MSRPLATAALLGVTAVWGWTFVIVHEAVAVYGVLAFLAARFGLAAAAAGALWGHRLDRRSLRTGAGIGLVLAMGYLFQTWGLRHTTPTNSGLITGLFVVFAPVADRVLYGTRMPRPRWLAVGLSLVGMVLSSAIASYGFARVPFRGRGAMFAIRLATMMIPFPVIMVPSYMLFRELGWIGSFKPLWVPAWFASAFNVFLLRQFFMGIPVQLEESAMLDGCSRWRLTSPSQRLRAGDRFWEDDLRWRDSWDSAARRAMRLYCSLSSLSPAKMIR